jgi:cephalosporin hydroxylase
VFKERVKVIISDSVDPETVETIAKLVEGSKVMVTLDSLHTKEHVLKELRLYSRFVSLGSYLVVQDTNINNHPVLPRFGPGPMEALKEFLMENQNFVIDRSKEKHLLTYYPLGFLKRVK